MQFVDEFLSKMLGTVVGLTVKPRVFNAHKIVLDAGFDKGA